MGNKLVGRRRQVVEEKYTKPQGLYVNRDVDIKKLRKLIPQLVLMLVVRVIDARTDGEDGGDDEREFLRTHAGPRRCS